MSADCLRTELTRLLGCRYPIVQTAMGWVATPRLVAATTQAGGFGFLAAASIPPGQVEAAILQVKALTDGPFGVNFHGFQPNAGEVVEMVLRHKVAAVSYGRGPDAAMIGKLRQTGVTCMPTVGAVKHAVKAVQMGANAITIQGSEGGGHTGSVPTSLLLPQVLEAVDVPVIAAGGFYNGRGLAAALAYGAQGIAMGTRFLLTKESPVHQTSLSRYLHTNDPNQIRVSRAADGLPQRFIENDQLRTLENMGVLPRLMASVRYALQFRKANKYSWGEVLGVLRQSLKGEDASFAATIMAPTLPRLITRAFIEGDAQNGLLPSGQAAALIDDLPECAALIDAIVAQTRHQLRVLSQYDASLTTPDQ
ncbi:MULTISPECIES: nitronate monooxygenase [unclassified Pseudovibrio]|uniref:NAD(P)H-dependent flavin oxidoreductase n=1 Tax=unclassified Pseudovibrio TaxID=2627060 RepID=UPI00070A3D08|nr:MULTISPECIES: nitronate monooxygenase [unclassified Pseudovibrio]KZL15195.1 Nitronate monooxygenase [Pseudovibrio sp. Ad26]